MTTPQEALHTVLDAMGALGNQCVLVALVGKDEAARVFAALSQQAQEPQPYKPYRYHYHASYQKEPGVRVDIDGILLCDKPIDNMDRYGEVKQVIDAENAYRLTINSMSPVYAAAPAAPQPQKEQP